MSTYIILLRGINVGGKNKLPMKDFKAALGEHGFENVRSTIQSGNVLLDSDKRLQADTIADLVQTRFGFRPDVLLLSVADFSTALANCPFSEFEGKTVHFYFCADKPSLDEALLNKLKVESESYSLKEKVFYLHAPDGIGRSKLVANIERVLNCQATGRNLNTVLKVKELL